MDILEETKILLKTGTNEFEILEFLVNEAVPGSNEVVHHYFGMNVAKVKEVIESPANVEPKDYSVHPCFLGTVPLRDMILPVLDLSVWLDIPRQKHKFENVIVTEFSNSIQGFLVSGVTEIHRVSWKELIPPGGYLQKMETKSIIGMIDRGDHFIQLLDLEYIISDLDPNSTENEWKTTVKATQEYIALVAEDSPTIRLMLQKNLSASNFKAHIVNNGEEALTFLKALKEKALVENKDITDLLHIVISDIEMPLLDGFTLTKSIKDDGVLQKLPVILYSSIITKELRHKGEAVKADYQVSKPELDKMAEMAIKLIESR
ncbi:chemotaxis protein [Deltaproteobacteria bacterium TL4]